MITAHLSNLAMIGATVIPIIIFLVLPSVLLLISDRIKQSYYLFLLLAGLGLLALKTHISGIEPFLKWPVFSHHTFLFLAIPILLFEMAFKIDPQKIREHFKTTCVIGILDSLLSIGLLSLFLLTILSFSLPMALLVGTLLNTTDPRLTLQIFKKINAPKQLYILLANESILNQVLVIITVHILFVQFSMLSHPNIILSQMTSLLDLFKITIIFLGILTYQFLMGLAIGVVITFLTLKFIHPIRTHFVIQLSLAISLAYLSFFIAQTVFEISGASAAIAAGMTFGHWDRMKSVYAQSKFLKHALRYLVYLISGFLLLSFCLTLKWSELTFPIFSAGMIFVAMILIRSVLISTSFFVLQRKAYFEPIHPAYQAIMIWGGFKSPLTLILLFVLSRNTSIIPVDPFLTQIMLTTVLLSWIIQSFSLPIFSKWLYRHNSSFSDLLATTNCQLRAAQEGQIALQSFQTGGLFSQKIQKLLQTKQAQKLNLSIHATHELREQLLQQPEGLQARLAFHRCFSIEKQLFSSLFRAGQLTEPAFKQLDYFIETQLDYTRHIGSFSEKILLDPNKNLLRLLERLTQKIPGLNQWTQSLIAQEMSVEYEVVWALRQGALKIIPSIETEQLLSDFSTEIQSSVQTQFKTWENISKTFLDHLADQFPEFVHQMQLRLANRLLFNTQIKSYQQSIQAGYLPAELGNRLIQELENKTNALRAPTLIPLRQDPHELLLKIPVFKALSIEAVETILNVLISHSYRANETIISEGDWSRSMYVISRGVVRVTKNQPDGQPPKAIATLFAGDFFGETALLHPKPRTANCIAVTPCALFELTHESFLLLVEKIPMIQNHLMALEESRKA